MSVTLASMQIGNPSGNVSASGTVRYYFTADFTDTDGTFWKAGAIDSKNYFLSNTWTVSAGLLTVASKPNFPSTFDGLPQGARVTAVLYDSNVKNIGTLFENWDIPTGVILNREFLIGWNGRSYPLRAVETLSKFDFLLMLQQQSGLNVAGVGLLGQIETTVAPVDLLHPKAVENSDLRVPTQNENDALLGTDGSPSNANRYVTDSDPRFDATVISLSDDAGTPLLTGALQIIGSGGTSVTASGQQLIIAGGGGGGSDAEANTDSGNNLGTTVTAAGSAVTTIVINHPITQSLALTVPSNISLVFSGSGTLTLVNNNVTIEGPISVMGGPRQIFIYSGSGTVLFTSNICVKDIHADWWGFNATDATPYIQAALTAWTYGQTLHLGHHDYKHTGLTIDRKFQGTLIGNDSADGYVDAATGPRFLYIGTDGGNAIIISNCYACTFRGFASYGAVTLGATGAARNLYVTMAASGYPPISSQNIFEALFINAQNTRSDYVAIDIDNPSNTNNEFHRFRGCKLIGGNGTFGSQAGIGIRIGHPNVKQIHIDGSSFLYFAKAIVGVSGSFRGNYNTFTNCSIIYYGVFSDAVYISGDDSEGCTQVLQYNLASGSGAPFTIVGSRYQDLRGAGTPSASRTNDPILRWTNLLTVQGSVFSAWGNGDFTSNFLNGYANDDVSVVGSLEWNGNPPVHGFSNLNLLTGFSSFATATVIEGDPTTGLGGLILGGTTYYQNTLQGMMSTPMVRDVIGVQQNLNDAGIFLTSAAQDSIEIGGGQIELLGLARPAVPEVTFVGSNDSGQYIILAVIARDSLGNRTMPSTLNQSIFANTTLSGSNYIHVIWPKVPGRTDYLLLQYSGGTWRSIATVTPSGTNIESYDIIANPAGAYTYVIPTYNETSTLKFRGAPTFDSASPIAFTPVRPATITANQNNYNPTPTAPFSSTNIFLNSDASRDITGLTFTKTQTDGQHHVITNTGAQNIVLKHQSASSTAANRFFNSTAADITLAANQAADVEYDTTNAYWRLFKRS